MKKKSLILTFLGSALLLLLLMDACTKQSAPKVKSATLSMKALNRSSSASALTSIPVNGGVLNLSSAFVNIAALHIEENSGNENQNEKSGGLKEGGEGNEGGGSGIDNDSINNNDTINEGGGNQNENDSINDGGNESDTADVFLAGPYPLDISTGQATIDQVNVYPGTFKKVNLDFQTSTGTNFYGNSVVIKGQYTPTSGTPVPFTIESTFSKHVQLPLANGGVTVTANSQVSIAIVFDINTWIGNLDFSGAQVANGEILINSTNNTTQFTTFEANLSANIDAEGE